MEGNEFVPYIASITDLMFYGQHIASGSILSDRFIVTSAGAMSRSHSRHHTLTVIAGLTMTWGWSNEQYRVDDIISHPDFDADTNENDIALLLTTTPINFHERVQPIDFSSYHLGLGDVVFSGFGLDDLNQFTHNPLESIASRVLSNEECRQWLAAQSSVPIFDSKVCIILNDERGICRNDYGAPLTVGNQLVGLSSWNVPCTTNSPVVIERISWHLDFIRQHTSL